jgi:hypothetical protein
VVTKFKVKGLQHPVLDQLILEKGLVVSRLMPRIAGTERCLKVENAPYDMRAELFMCEDVETIIETFKNPEPVCQQH